MFFSIILLDLNRRRNETKNSLKFIQLTLKDFQLLNLVQTGNRK